MDHFKNFMSVQELADHTDKSIRRIQQLAPDLIKSGCAMRFGKVLICHISSVSFINSIPEKRGRKLKS